MTFIASLVFLELLFTGMSELIESPTGYVVKF